jgi:hypothetical protein
MPDGALPYVYVRCDQCGRVLRSKMPPTPMRPVGVCSEPVRCPIHRSGYGAKCLCWREGEESDLYEPTWLLEQHAMALEWRNQPDA